MGDNLETIKVLQRGHSLDNIHAYLEEALANNLHNHDVGILHKIGNLGERIGIHKQELQILDVPLNSPPHNHLLEIYYPQKTSTCIYYISKPLTWIGYDKSSRLFKKLDVNINCGGVSLAPSSALFAIVYSRKSDSYRILDCKISCQDAVLVNGKPCAGKLVDGDSLTIASYPQLNIVFRKIPGFNEVDNVSGVDYKSRPQMEKLDAAEYAAREIALRAAGLALVALEYNDEDGSFFRICSFHSTNMNAILSIMIMIMITITTSVLS